MVHLAHSLLPQDSGPRVWRFYLAEVGRTMMCERADRTRNTCPWTRASPYGMRRKACATKFAS